jgi:hypothetical protein
MVMVTQPLVTLEQVKARLRIDAIDDQADVEDMMLEGTDIVLGYLKLKTVPWSVDTVPARIRTAILLVIRALYDGEENPLSQAVLDVLHRDRDPALA